MGSFRPGFAKGCGIFLDRVEGGRGGGGGRKLFGKKRAVSSRFFLDLALGTLSPLSM